MKCMYQVSLFKSGKILFALLVMDWLLAGSTDASTRGVASYPARKNYGIYSQKVAEGLRQDATTGIIMTNYDDGLEKVPEQVTPDLYSPKGFPLLIDEPGFTGPIANVTAPLGREAILACTVHNLSTYKVAWLRVDTQTILTIHIHVISRSRRVGVTQSDHRTWFLHIRELRETDRGWYMCQINTDPMKSQLGYLDVVVPPDILDRGTSRDQTVREGASISLTCAATGSPQPQIVWRREHSKSITLSDGIQVSSLEGPVLNISRVNRQHAGAYLCIASNGVPPTVSKRIMLTVEFPPVITIRNQLVGAALGSELVLQCDTEAYPKPVSYWSRENGEIVPVGGGLEPLKFDGAFRSVLRLPIKRVMSSDYGAYKCVSKNALGDTEGTIKLYPMPQPAPENKNVIQRLNIVAEQASEITPYGTQDFRLQDYSSARAISADRCCYGFLPSLVILIKIAGSRG